MKPEHKKSILENIGKKSIKEIAGELGIKERKIQRFLKDKEIMEKGIPEKKYKDETQAEVIATKKQVHLLFITAIFLLVFLSYSNTFKNDFIWDDEFLVINNSYIKNFSHITDIFKTYLASSSGNINNFYRPIQELSYMIDYFLWGNKPPGFHLTSIFLHALCAIAVYILSLRLLKNSVAAFVSGALFGAHPINTEAVTYVAGRADPLYLFFFLTSFILFLKSTDSLIQKKGAKIGFYILSVFCYVLSILSKEIGIMLPSMLVIYIISFYSNRPIRNRLYALSIPFACVAFFYIVARKTFLDFSGIAPSFVMGKFNIYMRLLTTFKAIWVYIGLLIMPIGLHMERTIAVAQSILEPYSLLATLGILTLSLSIWRSYNYSKKIFFICIWFFIGLLPVSNIIPINSFIAEHWLYLPAISLYMLAGLSIAKIFDRRSDKPFSVSKIISGIFVLIAIFSFYSALTIERNKDWKDEISFFKNTLKYSPNNARLHLNFGNTYSEHGQEENAIEEYKKAIELQPKYPEAYSNIGAAYISMGRYKEAKDSIEKAISLKPDFPNALYMLGSLYEREGDYKKAEGFYLKALNIMPDFIAAHMQLGRIYLNTGEREKAVFHWKNVLQIDPNFPEAKQLIGEYENR